MTTWNSIALSSWWVSFMANTLRPDQLGEAIAETLTVYSEDVNEKLTKVGRKHMKMLVARTRETAPKGRRNGKNFASSITSTEERVSSVTSNRFIWHVKAPNHRLTHLLVHGHATKNGGRTKASPFLQNALDEVLPEYEKAVEEAVK